MESELTEHFQREVPFLFSPGSPGQRYSSPLQRQKGVKHIKPITSSLVLFCVTLSPFICILCNAPSLCHPPLLLHCLSLNSILRFLSPRLFLLPDPSPAIEPAAKEAEVARRFSLTSSSSSSSFATRRTKGPLSASIKSKRHEIKSDPTPFGYEDTLRGAMAAVGKRQSMISSTATAASDTSAFPRSTSQPGWVQRRLPSMDADDFETIPSSAEESSNSSEEEGNNKNGDSGRYRVQLTYESREASDLSLEKSDLVQFLEEAENRH
ncbi:uncharacterized protein LOC119888799 [Micropterus salmoides]|uniref:uncharacterized protein LOC119888799 n=1 Tax=Micropterus salmoides TaxID=27706 RepID=UPI0018ED4924|nr:uncharacterized protein LOC119888799 [Micropterus salmoides]